MHYINFVTFKSIASSDGYILWATSTVHNWTLLYLCEIIHQLCPRLSNMSIYLTQAISYQMKEKRKIKNMLLTLDSSPRRVVMISCV